MNRKVKYISLVILLLIASLMLNGCRRKYQVEKIVEPDGLVMKITGPPDDLSIALLNPNKEVCVTRSIKKIKMVGGRITIDLPFGLTHQGVPLFPDKIASIDKHTLVIVNGKGETVYQKKIGLIRVNGKVSIARPD